MQDLGIDRQKAEKLLEKNIKNPITRYHLLESEAIMAKLAYYLCSRGLLGSEDLGGIDCKELSSRWGIIGLLHDIDWDITKDNPDTHCLVAKEILENAGGSPFLIETIQSHAWGKGGVPAFSGLERKTKLEHALAASETLTGLIVSSALVQPDKKLKSVTLDSLKKKFKSKGFARGCSREIIKECELLGISLDEFLKIGLEALQEISDEIGL
jgi:predicted hydrolase (HD superfamily)